MASSSNAIKMGRAFVQFFVEDNLAYRALDRFGNRFKSWGATMRNMGAALGAGGGAILAPLLTGLKDATDRAAELQQVADRIGENVTATSTLAGGFERVGITAEQFGGIVEGLKIRIEEAADTSGYLHEQIKSMGPAMRLSGQDTREQLNAIAEAFTRIRRGIDQTRAAKSLGLEAILPQLKKGRAGIDELYASGAAGAVSGAEGAAALEATRAMTAGWVEFKDAVRQVGMALLPTAEQIKEWRAQLTGTLTQVREWVKENRNVVIAAAAVGVGLVAAGVVVVGLGATVAVTGKLILLTVAGVKLAFGLLLAPVLSVKGAFIALGIGVAYLVSQTQTGQEAIAYMRDGLVSFAARAKEAFGSISDAVAMGDWALAWKVGLAALKVEWTNFTFYLQVGWNVTKAMFVDTWRDAVAGIKLLFIDLGAFISKGVRAWLNQMAALGEALDPLGKRGAIGRNIGRTIRGLGNDLTTDEQAAADRNAVLAERGREQRESDQHRAAAAGAALDAYNAARRELADLQSRVRSLGGAGDLSEMFGGIGAGVAETIRAGARGFSGPARLADAVKGVTGSSAVIGQQLAYGDTIPQRQLDATEGVRDVLTANLPQMARDMNALAGRGRVQ